MYELCIVLPCYNESENLESIFKQYLPMCKKADWQLVLVDNGSRDDSYRMMLSLADKYDNPGNLRIVKVDVNIGYGFGIREGLLASEARILAYSHADAQYDAAAITDAYKIYVDAKKKNPAARVFVKGIRKNRKIADIFFSRCFDLVTSLLYGTIFYEITAQPKLFDKDIMDYINIAPWDFSFDLFILSVCKKTNYVVKSFPVPLKPRLTGKSSWFTGFGSRVGLIRSYISYALKNRRLKFIK